MLHAVRDHAETGEMRGRWIFQIDFGRIRAMGSGGRREAFEQFVCELAARSALTPMSFSLVCTVPAGMVGWSASGRYRMVANTVGGRSSGWIAATLTRLQFCDARVRAHGDLGRRRPTLYPAQVGIGRGGQSTQWGSGLVGTARGSGWPAVAASPRQGRHFVGCPADRRTVSLSTSMR